MKHKLKYLIPAVLVGAAGLVLNSLTARAITPPDSCFDFEATVGAIIRYYDNEANDTNQPACPKAIEIPEKIFNKSVRFINDNAFKDKGLTEVTIPSGINEIGAEAFSKNYLTSITIPNGVIRIRESAFSFNNLTSVTLPEDLDFIETTTFAANKIVKVAVSNQVAMIATDAFSFQSPFGRDIMNNLGTPQFLEDVKNLWYVQIETKTSSNPNNLIDGTGVFSINGTEWVEMGGHLIDAARLKITYEDEAGTEIAPAQIITGVRADKSLMPDYTLRNGQPIPGFVDAFNPQAAEWEANLATLQAAYQRVGQTRQAIAPEIAGYKLRADLNATQDIALTSGETIFKFIYTKSMTKPGVDTSSDTPEVKAPSSGIGQTVGSQVTLTLLTGGLVLALVVVCTRSIGKRIQLRR